MKRFLGVFLFLFALSSLLFAEGGQSLSTDMLHSWKLAFVRDNNIWVSRGDGKDQRLLIENGRAPSWSPDKTAIAFVRAYNIWIANADGSNQHPVTSMWDKCDPLFESRCSDITISWHPKKDFLTFSHPEVFKTTRIIGISGIVPAKNESENTILGSTIFDVQLRDNEPGKVSVRYDLYGGGTSFFFTNHDHPAWSLSGKKLAFTRNGDIWEAQAAKGEDGEPPTGWEVTRLAAVASYDEPTNRGSRNNRGATKISWHPDENLLAYSYDRLQGSGFNEVHLLNLRNGRDTLVVRDARNPCFSPDGRFVVYQAYGKKHCGTDGFCICAVSLDGRIKRKLVARGTEPAW
jgi:dipeptidyl aminopeptidase/acylaminoacyl peptidase